MFSAQVLPVLAQSVQAKKSAAGQSRPERAATRLDDGGPAQRNERGAIPQTSGDSRATFSRQDYERCQTTDEAVFRRAIKSITLTALREGTAQINYLAIVNDQWRAGGLDQIVDQRVDAAAAEIREETDWSELLKSLAFRKQAQELARATAERTYRSAEMKAALERLAGEVGREIGQAIVLTTADAAQPAQRCLKAYLGPRYGTTVARSVNRDAGAAFEIDPATSQATVTTGTVLLETSTGITGAVLLLVRRQMGRMAQRLGQRLVGSVLGRLVSAVAGGVGLVLIAKEFWDLRHGVLPIVAEEMKSEGSKDKVRAELAKSIKEQIAAHLDELAARTADKIVDIWHDFRRAHQKVVQIASRDEKFKAFLDTAAPSALPRLDEIVALVLEKEGPEAVRERLDNGTLHIALNKMPEAGMQIAREERSLAKALTWTALAGDRIDTVTNLDIHKYADPKTLSKRLLERIIALRDRLAISKVAPLGVVARNALLELDKPQLINLSRALNGEELASLAQYVSNLEPAAAQRVLRVVGNSPERMQRLARSGVRDAIVASRDQTAAVGMMLTDHNVLNVGAVIRHVELVWDGEVRPWLLWQRHPAVIIAAGVLLLVVLLMLRSLIFGRRRSKAKST